MKNISELIQYSNINKRDARYILMCTLNIDNNTILTNSDTLVSDDDVAKFNSLIEQVSNGIPIAYVVSKALFMGLNFYINNNVLIPRQETEQLVEEAIYYIKRSRVKSVLDMCTGSGCILISIAYFTNIIGIGADISHNAIKVANKNANINNLQSRLTFIQGDLFENIKTKSDIIICNPPYIPTKHINFLEDSVKCYEPHISLDGGLDGLLFYNKIAEQASNYLFLNGIIFLEIGYNQANEVKRIFYEKGYASVIIKKDYAGHDRIAIITYS